MLDHQVWIEALKGIPAVATGSLLTLFGVWLQSRSESNRLKIQLQHDAGQREKERQMDLRREVFLGVAEALGRQSEYINLFGKVDFDFWKEQELIKGNIGAGNKLNLIAGIETIEAYARANQAWAKALFELTKMRLQIEEVKGELKSQDEIIAMLSAYRDETLASMKAAGSPGFDSPEAFNLSRSRFDELQSKISDESLKKARLHSTLATLLMEISVVGMAAHVEFSQKLLAVNLAARREVELPIDENRYREFHASIANEAQEASCAFVEEMKSWISKQEGER